MVLVIKRVLHCGVDDNMTQTHMATCLVQQVDRSTESLLGRALVIYSAIKVDVFKNWMEKKEGNLSREMERRLQNQTQEIWLRVWLYGCMHTHSHELIQEKLKKFKCISYTSCSGYESWEFSYGRGGLFGVRIQGSSILWWKRHSKAKSSGLRRQKHDPACSHPSQQREDCKCLLFGSLFSLLVLSGNTTHEMMTYQHQVRNPADPLWKQPHRHTQRCTSLLTCSFLNAPMLIKINHNTQFYTRDMLASKSETLGTAHTLIPLYTGKQA